MQTSFFFIAEKTLVDEHLNMKVSAGSKRAGFFLVFSFVGLFLFLKLESPYSWISFLISVVVGSIGSSRLYARSASLEEKKADLEERNRNGLG